MTTTWYEAGLCFPLGAIYSALKEKVKNTFVLRNHLFFICIGILALTFVITLFFGNKTILPEGLRIMVKMTSSILFSLLFALFFSKFNINFFFTRFLGKYSLEIYLTQGIFLNLFVEQLPIKNDWVYILVTAFSTILFSIIVHPIFTFIIKLGNKFKKESSN
jgi:peptidoglycan/LPS O-acetylase OafA/YrhL